MSVFNFKSAVCTSREQSERLLALGVKPETADMVHFFSQSLAQDWTIVPLAENETAKNIEGVEIPAWSLHRLVSTLINNGIIITFIDDIVIIERYKDFQKSYEFWDDLCDNLIDGIEWLIKEGYFNKEYLEE